MTEKDNRSDQANDLRKQAEELARKKEALFLENIEAVSPEETRQALHELQVHQIELTLQNEELRRTQVELDISRTRYFDLYDLAPIGYFTLSEKGLILETNLTAAALFGVTRDTLIRLPLSSLILSEDQDIYYRHRKKLFETGKPEVFEIRMLKKDGALFWAHLTATVEQENSGTSPVGDNYGSSVCRIVMSDITERKQAEEVFAFLAQAPGVKSGEDFFELLASYLAKNLGMDFVCIDRLEGDGLNARTVAVWCDGKFEDNVTYALKDTPCGEVVGKTVCCFPASVCKFFPRDEVLTELRAESYVGVTLWSHTGKPIGLIAVIGRRPLVNRESVENMLKTVAIRGAGEMERLIAEEQIKSLLSEKELLLREVHHRIKNNMSVITGMLMLQAETLKEPSAIAALKDAQGRVRSMMVLYDKLYRSADFKSISIKEYLTSLIHEIIGNFPGHTSIKVETRIDDCILEAKTLSPVGIILNELLTNAMKHAFTDKEKGAIEVSLSIKDNHAILMLQDNGAGIPESIDTGNSTGFGLQLVNMLTEQLEGTIRIEREKGARFVLEFEIQ